MREPLSPESPAAAAASGAPEPGARAEARLPRAARALVALGALLPALLAVGQLGRLHPDEVYQLLEPAWFRAHGYGVLAWEWQAGLRNWALPLLAAGVLRLAHALGLQHPLAYRGLLALFQAALHAAALIATWRYARRRTEGPGALLATALVALYAPVLVFAGRTLGESFSADLLLLAFCALDAALHGAQGRARRAGLAGGMWLGLAVVARYASGIFVLAALLGLATVRPGRRVLAWVLAGGAGVALALAALDTWSWGAPLHSLLAYLRFNVLSDGAVQQFGAEPAAFYLRPLLLALPPWVLLALPAALRTRRLPLPLLAALAYFAALLATPHKEDRFLYPGLVLLALAAAPAAAGLLRAVARRAGPGGGGLAAAAALLCGLLPLGHYPAIDPRGDQFRAIVRASRGDATGLLIVNEGLWGAGGYFYLGRHIPWATCDWPHDAAFQRAMGDARFNRAVTFEGRALAELQAAGFRVVGQEGRETLLAR